MGQARAGWGKVWEACQDKLLGRRGKSPSVPASQHEWKNNGKSCPAHHVHPIHSNQQRSAVARLQNICWQPCYYHYECPKFHLGNTYNKCLMFSAACLCPVPCCPICLSILKHNTIQRRERRQVHQPLNTHCQQVKAKEGVQSCWWGRKARRYGVCVHGTN